MIKIVKSGVKGIKQKVWGSSLPKENKSIKEVVESQPTGPIFIEMGSDPDSIKHGLEKVGREVLFLYDIDDTLYHPSNDLQRKEREFLMEKYSSLSNGMELEAFDECLSTFYLYSSLFHNHGKIPLEEYWEMVSEFDYLQFLTPDPRLRDLLLSMKNIRRCCFTNGPRDRAENILTKLGLMDCFDVVICVGKYDKTFCCKPRDSAYEFVVKVLGIEAPGNVHFFDDAVINIDKAIEVGWNGWLMTENDNVIDVSSRVLQAIGVSVSPIHESLTKPESLVG